MDEIENKITMVKLSLTELHTEETNIEIRLAEVERFIKTVELAWYDAQPEIKVKLQRAIFPKGVSYQKSDFSNSEISHAFATINNFATKKSTNVTQEGIEPSTYSLEASCSIR